VVENHFAFFSQGLKKQSVAPAQQKTVQPFLSFNNQKDIEPKKIAATTLHQSGIAKPLTTISTENVKRSS
jgi:hypothetical protein